MVAEAQIEKARPGYVGADDLMTIDHAFGDGGGQVARRHTGRLGQHHGQVAGHVAMARIARRLDRDP